MIIIAIDQSSGASSAVGVAVLTRDLDLVATAAFRPKKKYVVVEKRLVCLHDQLTEFIAPYIALSLEGQIPIEVCFERTVMLGKSGESLAESVGAFAASFPNSDLISFHKVHNLQMKKFISGTGASDKVGVAKGILKYLPSIEHDKIISLLNGQQYDSLDAVAIGITHILTGAKPHVTRTRATSRKKQ
jgi:Holliday junction resolvasome RuvABC endonuclease subunit